MSEYILYRDLKVTGHRVGIGHNRWWNDGGTQFSIHIENLVTGRSGNFEHWHGKDCGIQTLDQKDLAGALHSIVSEASYTVDSFEEYCDNLEADSDSLSEKEKFEWMKQEAERFSAIDTSDIAFWQDREFLDYQTQFHNHRAYSTSSDSYTVPSEAIILLDDREILAQWEEDRAHPGGPSTARMGDGWVDQEHKMPYCDTDVVWTWLWNDKTSEQSYNITPVQVQLTKSEPNQDDDYYLTI